MRHRQRDPKKNARLMSKSSRRGKIYGTICARQLGAGGDVTAGEGSDIFVLKLRNLQ